MADDGNSDRDMHQAFLHSFPIDLITIKTDLEVQSFLNPEDATEYVKQLFRSPSEEVTPFSIHSQPIMKVKFAGDLVFTMKIEDPRHLSKYASEDLLDQIPLEMIEDTPLDDFVRQTAMIRLMLYIYKNHIEGTDLVPDGFKQVFYDNLLRTNPTGPRKGFDNLTSERAQEFDEMITTGLVQMAHEMVESYPPTLRKQLEKQYNIPSSPVSQYSGFKFYNEEEFR